MTHRTAGAAAAALALLALAGCSSTRANSAAGPTLPPGSTTAAATPTAAGPPTSARGTIVKAMGQEGGWGQMPGGASAVTFAVDSIATVKCDNPYSQPPVNGQFIAAHMRLSTAPGATTDEMGYTNMNPAQFQFIGSDNVTRTNIASPATYSCLKDSEQFPNAQLGPGQQYVGDLVFDVPEPHGVLIYAPGNLANSSGWEWDF